MSRLLQRQVHAAARWWSGRTPAAAGRSLTAARGPVAEPESRPARATAPETMPAPAFTFEAPAAPAVEAAPPPGAIREPVVAPELYEFVPIGLEPAGWRERVTETVRPMLGLLVLTLVVPPLGLFLLWQRDDIGRLAAGVAGAGVLLWAGAVGGAVALTR